MTLLQINVNEFLLFILSVAGANSKSFSLYRPLHLCVTTWNIAIVKRWVELASREEIAEAIDIPTRVGTALCMAAALKKEHEAGKLEFDLPFFFCISTSNK